MSIRQNKSLLTLGRSEETTLLFPSAGHRLELWVVLDFLVTRNGILKEAQQRLFFLTWHEYQNSLSTIESVLTCCITVWFGYLTCQSAWAYRLLQRTEKTELPQLDKIYTTLCKRKTQNIIKNTSFPAHVLFSHASRLSGSFFPQAGGQLNR